MKKGFTLIELLIVVAIIGILAGVGIPMYNGYMKTAKINAVKKQHNQIVSYLSAEFQKCHMGSSTIFQDTWKKNQENCPIPQKNYVLRASASDTLSDKWRIFIKEVLKAHLIAQPKKELSFLVQIVNQVAIGFIMLIMSLQLFHILMMMEISRIMTQIPTLKKPS